MADPTLIINIPKAANRLAQAIEQRQSLGIIADFDVDGASATALIYRYCQWFGIRPIIDVPDRIHEGYGPNQRMLDDAVSQHCHLLLCLDCGTTAADILNQYRSKLEIIIIDHHQATMHLPEVFAIINPWLNANSIKYFGHLAAVGVLFMLLVATNTALKKSSKILLPDLMQFLDIVALGTVCDIVPLNGINRALVLRGLEYMRRYPRAGLLALMQYTNIQKNTVNTEDLSFKLGPCLNAGSRKGFSTLAWQLLSVDNTDIVKIIASKLNQLNILRKQESIALAVEAENNIEQGTGFIMVAGDGWSKTILGILAARLCRRFQQPCFVISFDNKGRGSGSARSIEGIPLAPMIHAALDQSILDHGGGHAMAAGFSIQKEQKPFFFSFLEQYLSNTTLIDRRKLEIEFVIKLSQIKINILRELKRLEPFDKYDNPEPLFLLKHVRIRQSIIIGTEHIRAQIIDDDYNILPMLLFNEARTPLGQLLLHHSGYLDLVVKLKQELRYTKSIVAYIEDANVSSCFNN